VREIGRPDHASSEQLSALLDERPEPGDRAFLAEHVDDCVVCSNELADLRSVRDLLRAMPVYLPPRSFTIPIEVALPAPRFRRLIPLTRVLGALAAVLCVVLFATDAMQLGDRAAPVPDGGAAFQITTAARQSAPQAKPAMSAAESGRTEAAQAAGATAPTTAPPGAPAKPAEAAKPAAPAVAAKPADPAAAKPAESKPAEAARSAFAPAPTQAPGTVQSVGAVRTIVATPPAPAQAAAPAPAQAQAPPPQAQPAPAQAAGGGAPPANADTSASASASAPSAAAAAAPAPPAAAAIQAPQAPAPAVAASPVARQENDAARTGAPAAAVPPALATATVPAVISGEPGLTIERAGPATSRTSPWLSPVRLWALGLAVVSAALLIGSFVLSRLARTSARTGRPRA
jgi:hypothetical protein